jgi:hypothetical protein
VKVIESGSRLASRQEDAAEPQALQCTRRRAGRETSMAVSTTQTLALATEEIANSRNISKEKDNTHDGNA